MWRSQHLGNRSSLGSPEHSPGKEGHGRCWYCSWVLIGVPLVPWRLIPVKPLNGFRISALWQMTSSTLRSEDIPYTRDSTTDILNVCFVNLQFKIKHSEMFWRCLSGGDCLKIKSPNSRFTHVCQVHEWMNSYRFSLEPTDIWFLRYRPIMAISNPKITVLSSFARGRNGLLYINGYWELFLIADSSSSSRIHRMQTSALSFLTRTGPDFSGFFYQPTMGSVVVKRGLWQQIHSNSKSEFCAILPRISVGPHTYAPLRSYTFCTKISISEHLSIDCWT